MKHYGAYYKSKLSVPIPLANLKLWLKADAGITKDGSNYVSEWQDFSGNGNNAVQAIGANQPLFVDNEVNGNAVIRFSGNQVIIIPANLIGNTNDKTIIIVYKLINTSTYGGLITSKGSGDESTAVYHDVGNSDYQVMFGNGLILSATVDMTSTYHILIATSATQKTVHINGVLKNSNPGAYTINNAGVDTYIGTYRCSYANFIHADIAEMIIYDSALSTADRQQVENYLSAKYGI
jgi:hypothetical protein